MDKVAPGQTISARAWNRMVEASEWYHRHMARGLTGQIGASFGDSNIIKVRNDSGDIRRQGEILEFTGSVLSDPEELGQQQIWAKGDEPTLANGFGVLLESLPEPSDDEPGIGAFQVAGACAAFVNILDADDRYARAVASNCVLQSVPIGPVRIIYKPTGTGEKMCWVHLLGVTGEVLVKNQSGGDYSANGGPHDYHVYKGTPGGFTDTNQVLSAYNIPAFKTGKMGAASLLEGIAYAAPWET
jgi:hypothetical protein